MPVRIYDIAKKLGIESKEVLARAKALGIAAAKVPSSSLDKITAEYLEQELGGVRPPPVTAEPAAPQPPSEPVIIVAPPPEAPAVAAQTTESVAAVETTTIVAETAMPSQTESLAPEPGSAEPETVTQETAFAEASPAAV